MEIKDIIEEWSFWTKPLPPSTPRHVSVPTDLPHDLILVVKGVRRAGKTTFLQQIPNRLGLNFNDCYFCNFGHGSKSSVLPDTCSS